MSAFHLSGDTIFLEKAKDLGQRLLGAFTSSSGIPYSDVNLIDRSGHAPKWSPDSSTISFAYFILELTFYVCLFFYPGKLVHVSKFQKNWKITKVTPLKKYSIHNTVRAPL